MVRTHNFDQQMEKKLYKCFAHHPLLATLLMIVCLPAGMLLAVGCGTVVLAIPLAWILRLI